MEVIATVRRNNALCFRSCLKRSQPKAEITSHTASLVPVTEKKKKIPNTITITLLKNVTDYEDSPSKGRAYVAAPDH